MAPGAAPEILQLIAAAVTPVVLISASAILVSAVNTKHQAMSDRLRFLAQELRQPGVSPERGRALRIQIHLFLRRLGHVARAHVTLYLAVACFTLMIAVLTLSARSPVWDRIVLGLFLGGVGFVFLSITSELRELGLASQTLSVELADVLTEPHEGAR